MPLRPADAYRGLATPLLRGLATLLLRGLAALLLRGLAAPLLRGLSVLLLGGLSTLLPRRLSTSLSGRLSTRLPGWLRELLPERLRPYPAPVGAARRALLEDGIAGSALILAARSWDGGAEKSFRVRVRLPGGGPYETAVRQRVSPAEAERMRPGKVVRCRVDPQAQARLVLYLPGVAEYLPVAGGNVRVVGGKVMRGNEDQPGEENPPDRAEPPDIERILAQGRRAEGRVLATAPVAVDYAGDEDPVLRLDLELRAWDEPQPWRVRVIQAVPLAALGSTDRGSRVEVAFFAVDRGESVAVDWPATLRTP